jgi:hypothetical protein
MATTIERPRFRNHAPRPDEPLRLRRAPASTRIRVPELLVGLLLIGGFGLGAVAWHASAGSTEPVAVLATAVDKGTVLTDSVLRPAEISRAGAVAAVPWAQRGRLIGRIALADLPAATVVIPGLVGDEPSLAAGEALVGLELAPGSYPAGSLAPGDAVAVVLAAEAGADASASPLAPSASVWEVTDVADQEGTVLVTLRLPEADAQLVSAMADRARVVRVVR